MSKLPNMKRWSDAQLDKELAFAIAASDEDHAENQAWITKFKIEVVRRKALGLAA